MTIYFIAVDGNILHAVGYRFYTELESARLVCAYWNAMVDAKRWRVYQTTIANVTEDA